MKTNITSYGTGPVDMKSNMTRHCNCTGNMGMATFVVPQDGTSDRMGLMANMTLRCNNTNMVMNTSTALQCNCTQHKEAGHCNCTGNMGIFGKMFDTGHKVTHNKHHCNCTGHLGMWAKNKGLLANMTLHCYCPGNTSMTASIAPYGKLANMTHRGNNTLMLTNVTVHCNCSGYRGINLLEHMAKYCNCTGHMGVHMTNSTKNHTVSNVTHHCNCTGHMGTGAIMIPESTNKGHMGLMANMTLYCNNTRHMAVNSSAAFMCNCTKHNGIKDSHCNCTGQMGLIGSDAAKANVSSLCNCTGHLGMKAIHKGMMANVTLHCYCPGNRTVVTYMAPNGTAVFYRTNGTRMLTNVTVHCNCSRYGGTDMLANMNNYCNCTGHMGLHVTNVTTVTNHHAGMEKGFSFRYEPNTVSGL